LNLEQLEDRLVPSWKGTPPSLITVPAFSTKVQFSKYGDTWGQAAITTNEVDWYSFTAPATGDYHLEAWSPEDHLDTVLGVYNRLGQRLAFNDDAAQDIIHSDLTVTLTAGRPYYFGITNYKDTPGSSYYWYVSGPAQTATDDSAEENDTRQQAYDLGTLTGPKSLTALRMADAQDWFKFTTTGPGTAANFVSISFQHLQGDLDLKLYDSNGLEVGSSEGVGNAENISLAGLAAGTYYVQVFGANEATNPNYSLTINPATGPSSTNAWTVFVYLTASDLQQFAFRDINEMEYAAAQLPANVKLVLLWDQSEDYLTYATAKGAQQPWGTVGQAVIAPDTNMNQIATPFEILPEADTGDPNTLRGFLQWGAQAAPANHYALIIWSHGAGLYGSSYDDADGLDPSNLTIDGLGQALGASLGDPSVPPIQVMAYDACLMGMAEISYSIRGVVPVFAASEELVDATGHDYKTLFNVLKTNPDQVTPEQLGAGFVTSFGAQYVGTGTSSDTYSAVRSGQFSALASALQDFVTATATATTTERTWMRISRNSAIRYDGVEFKDYRDLGSFLRNIRSHPQISAGIRAAAGTVLNVLSSLVIAKTRDHRTSSGIAIYLPRFTLDPAYATEFAAFNAATGWNTFLTWLMAP
jgi:hypothetical protein